MTKFGNFFFWLQQIIMVILSYRHANRILMKYNSINIIITSSLLSAFDMVHEHESGREWGLCVDQFTVIHSAVDEWKELWRQSATSILQKKLAVRYTWIHNHNLTWRQAVLMIIIMGWVFCLIPLLLCSTLSAQLKMTIVFWLIELIVKFSTSLGFFNFLWLHVMMTRDCNDIRTQNVEMWKFLCDIFQSFHF